MAEFVEQRIQETISEIEELERIGLLSNKEVKTLTQKRKDFFYRLVRRLRNKCDVMNYIEYEMKLIELLRIRRKKIGMHEKQKQIEKAVFLRVMKHARYLTRMWPLHPDTWKLRIDFARFIGWQDEIGAAFREQISYLGNCENVWVAWAKWEVEQRKDFDKARTILLCKAQLYHPKSVFIKRELFRLELLYIESLMNKMKNDNRSGLEEIVIENREKVMNCAIARAVYQNSVTTLSEPELYLELYEVADKFGFALALRDEIYRDVSHKFPNAASVWKLKAKREVLGLTEGSQEDVKSDIKFDQEIHMNPKAKKKLEPMEKLMCIISTFDRATTVVGEGFVNVYISEILPLLYQCWGMTKMSDLIFKKLLSLCEAYTAVLSPLNFIVWHQVSCEQSHSNSQLRVVLEEAVRRHPESPYLKVELVRAIIREAVSDAELMKEFNKVASSLKGDAGLQAWQAVIDHMTNNTIRNKMFIRAINHTDDEVAQVMRAHHLKHTAIHKSMKSARKLYKSLSWKPPFSAKLHALMVELELTQFKLNVEEIRQVFDIAVQQHGTTNPGLWLAYIKFEKLHGDALKAGSLFIRAEKELEASHAHIFRELYLTLRELLGEEAASVTKCQSNKILVENVEHEDSGDDAAVVKPALVDLFEEELILSYTADQTRKNFFSNILTVENLLNKGGNYGPKEDRRVWEPVLQVLTGSKIVLSVQQVKDSVLEDEPSGKDLVAPRFRKRHQPSDQLKLKEDKDVKVYREDDIEKILKTSAILKPEFMQQTCVTPYYVSKSSVKKQNRKEREKTKGPGWFNMTAPEMTEEVRQDLEILQMRSVLDPKRHYKSDMKVLPKYFQMGHVVDNHAEFYSSRIPKKDRKRTLADEIIHDEETLRYQKKKYNEIILKKQKKQFNLHSQKKEHKTGLSQKKKHKTGLSQKKKHKTGL